MRGRNVDLEETPRFHSFLDKSLGNIRGDAHSFSLQLIDHKDKNDIQTYLDVRGEQRGKELQEHINSNDTEPAYSHLQAIHLKDNQVSPRSDLANESFAKMQTQR